MQSVSIAEAKAHISDLIAKNRHTKERFIITRHSKPAAALVSVEDLQYLQQHEARQGLADIAGKWEGFDEVLEGMGDLGELRQQGGNGARCFSLTPTH